MKTVKSKKAALAVTPQTSETRLNLVQRESQLQAQPAFKYQTGDMDMLERNAEKPLPAAFEQFDRTCKTVHRFVGWPFAIV